MTWWREVVISWPCETCGAGPGDRCRTTSGTAKYEAHASRSALASAHRWHLPEEESCHHCLDNPPRGHTCPRCKRKTPP